MAITGGPCTSYLADLHDGVHRPTDCYKLALYLPSATLSASTTRYSAAHEVPANGTYKAGGCELSGRKVTVDGCLSFANPSFTKVTITAGGALIYNATRGDKAVAVVEFEKPVSSTNATFDVELPEYVVELERA